MESHIRVYLTIISLKDICIYLDTPMPTFEDFLNEDLQKLIGAIDTRIRGFHLMFQQPLTGTYWEELLSDSFKDIGLMTSWRPINSHKVGEDMNIEGFLDSRISCKSGVLKNNRTHKLGPCVEFSSSRTTTQKTLDEKLKHLAKSHYDYHFLLTKKDIFDKTYELLIIKAGMCNVKDLTWKPNKNGKKGDYVSVDGPFKGTITNSMSGQLWITMPLSRATHRKTISLK